ncbi:hypothetical protein JKP88DRAFT_271006 [Tribonema minus]|uniref:Uncharacterized protein n=1 Tax=Tribonema minus TaxID=303371 RepID=A0A835YGX2_9STRA|nr:hypothetical protein JKP88DRAFT_271006 [Tribonema minus]
MTVIVGKGRIGNALYEMGDGTDTLVGRSTTIPDGQGPIYVCTRNDDLENVILRTPPSRRDDLVFLQNGILGPFLAKHGLSNNSQALIYFAVAKQGEKPIDGVTDVNPEGLTAATGKWAPAFKERLSTGGLSCHILNTTEFTAQSFEKHIWICAFMLVGVKHGASVGEVESTHGEEVRRLIDELLAATAAKYGARFRAGAPDRLCAYARSVAHYPTAVKEWAWRNGFYWALSKEALAAGRPDPTPLHTAMLRQAGVLPEGEQ